MRVGGNIGLNFKIRKVDLERHRDNQVKFIDYHKTQSLRSIANLIWSDFGDIFKKVHRDQDTAIEYEARLTIIQTEEFNKAMKMLNAKVVDLDEVRKAFSDLTHDSK